MSALSFVVLLTALGLTAFVLWHRRRLFGELGRLVNLVEGADPERPGQPMIARLTVPELERLRQSFARFFDRFTASRARQEEAEGTLGYVLDHAADAILVLDQDHNIVSWNRGAEETLGIPSEEIVGGHYARLIPEGREEEELERPLEPGSTVKDLRTQRLRRDGEVLEVSLTRSRIPGPEGGEERFVEILRDITATRRVEEDLLRTEKMAAVGKISSKVVHEIRNPLASINLNVDLLGDSLDHPVGGGGDPEAKEILGAIKREIRRLSQITEEYLQFSRLPRAAFREERVNDILVELSDFVRPSIARKGIRLVLNLDEGDPQAVCDATLLRQALLNLLRNSMDATEEDRGQIQMRTRAVRFNPSGAVPEPDDLPADAVEIVVEDNGRGIPKDQIDRIFEPFYTTKKDGTGLGLALVRRAVDEHHGRVHCVSVPGKGTTFRVLIPGRPPREMAGSEIRVPQSSPPAVQGPAAGATG
jgi:PAS domain S-box-containing protein